MIHFRILVAKFVTIYVGLLIALTWVVRLNWTALGVISLIFTVVGYVIGEWWALPHLHNLTLSLADFLFALLVIGWTGNWLYQMEWSLIHFSFFLAGAAFVALVEWGVHVYYRKKVLKRVF